MKRRLKNDMVFGLFFGVFVMTDYTNSLNDFSICPWLASCFRELLTGPLYYAITITLACVIYWRNSPNGIAAICNLCAGDGKETESLCMPVLSSLITGLSSVQYLNLFSCKLDIKNCICTFTDLFAINYCS